MIRISQKLAITLSAGAVCGAGCCILLTDAGIDADIPIPSMHDNSTIDGLKLEVIPVVAPYLMNGGENMSETNVDENKNSPVIPFDPKTYRHSLFDSGALETDHSEKLVNETERSIHNTSIQRTGHRIPLK